MFRMMGYSAFILVVLFFVYPITLQQTLPPKALNAERIKLLKDALSWMTFRKNGELASDKDLEPIFGALKERYGSSKFYKTMIIAFSRGVLPKLTLKENARCNPAYTLEYRDTFNNSVTDGQLKKFIIDSYDKRAEASRQFCDYRKGLVCSQQSSKCECPPGSKMGPISQGSPENRCLLEENEVCSLIDLDHDSKSDYAALKKLLPEMVLNLEKSMSCKMGTQCRFKSTNPTTPLCYPVNSGPWDNGRWDIDLGEECTLGLYGDTGQCKESPERDFVLPGYTCFNFGPRSQPKSPRVGFCAHDNGNYGLTTVFEGGGTSDDWFWDLQMIGFVSPATTPLRGKSLFDYYSAYRTKLWVALATQPWFQDDVTSIANYPGRKCNIANTEKMLELWKYFKSLEDFQGQGYLATEADLEAKFKEAEDLTADKKIKICRYRSEMYPNSGTDHALRCVRNSTDAAGNDGKCEKIPESEDVTWSFAKTFLEYRLHVRRTSVEIRDQEKNYRKDIYEPDLECDPKLGPPSGSQGAAPSTDSFVLEGGYCPPDRGCIEDYGAYQNIYHPNCSLNGARLYRDCQSLDDGRYHYGCEEVYLDNVFDEELKTLSSYSGLKRGEACKYELEAKLRDWVENGGGRVKGNKYKRLIELTKFKNDIGGNTLCDRTRMLECSEKSRTCECCPGTVPREVTLEAGIKYYSDYCYAASGECGTKYREPLSSIFGKSSEMEKNEIKRHYSSREDDDRCDGSNWCVFTIHSSWKLECTTNNTGSTGYLGEDPVTTTTTVRTTTTTAGRRTTTDRQSTTTDRDESELVCVGDQCGWQDAGKAQTGIHRILKMITLMKIVTFIA